MLSHLLALAAPAAAFLVVPEMAPASKPDEAEGAFKALPIEELSPFALPPSVQSQTVNIPCAECPGLDASLRFDIKVQDNNRLMVNGFEVYPADEREGDLTATVSSSNGGDEEEELAWVIWWQVVDEDRAQGMRIVDFHLGVAGVGPTPVSDVSIAMTLVTGPNGEVLIADLQTGGPSEPAEDARPPMHKPQCDGWFCGVEELWRDLFKGGMGCHRLHEANDGKPHRFDLPQMEDEEGSHHGHGRPGHGRPGHHRGPHHGHHHGHHLGKMIKNVAAHVFLPVVMGITAGVGAAV